MEKGFILFAIIGLVLLYLLNGFLNDIDTQSAQPLHGKEYELQKKFKSCYNIDDLGEQVLDASSLSEEEQIEVWRSSPLKGEMLTLFPQFDNMRTYVDTHVMKGYLKQKILSNLSEAEDKYFSGAIDDEQAKQIITKGPTK